MTFESIALKIATTEARKMGAEIRAAWVHKTDRQWEFVYRERVGTFYWWGRAENAIDAKAKGWAAWIKKTLGVNRMPKKKTRGRKPMPGKLVCIKLDQQALRDSRALGRRWGTQTPATIRQSLRYAAEREIS